MIEDQLKKFLDNNFSDDNKFALIKENGLSAILESYYSEYPLFEFAKNMKSNNRVIHIVKQGQMVKLIKDFNSNSIPVLYFKGVVLQSLLFDNIDVRPAGDIDIYIAPDKFNAGMSILKENGFILCNSYTINDLHHIQYVKGHLKLELHKNIFNPFTKINEAFFFDHIISYQSKCYSCLTFDKTATILHLFYHLYMDTLLSACNFDSIMKNNVTMAKRFLLRAYEIAKYIFLFDDQIDWFQINADIISQKLQIHFKNMIIMIEHIFPKILPKSFLATVYEKNYIE